MRRSGFINLCVWHRGIDGDHSENEYKCEKDPRFFRIHGCKVVSGKIFVVAADAALTDSDEILDWVYFSL